MLQSSVSSQGGSDGHMECAHSLLLPLLLLRYTYAEWPSVDASGGGYGGKWVCTCGCLWSLACCSSCCALCSNRDSCSIAGGRGGSGS